MAKTKKQTPAPKSPSLSRNGSKLIMQWTKGANNYSKYEIDKLIPVKKHVNGRWITVMEFVTVFTPGGSATSKTVINNIFDGSVNFHFRIRAIGTDTDKIDYTPSKYAECSYSLSLPIQPGVRKTVTGKQTTVFSYSTDGSALIPQHCSGTEWQSVLVPGFPSGDGATIFNTYGVSQSGNCPGVFANDISLPDNVDISNGASFTRWFRARAYGYMGYSDYSYINQTYAKPYAAYNVDGEAVNPFSSSCTINAKWNISAPADHPIDQGIDSGGVVLQWLATEPEITVSQETEGTAPNVRIVKKIRTISCPSDASGWGDIPVEHTKTNLPIPTGSGIPENKCLFFRVKTKYLYAENYSLSPEVLVRNGYGRVTNSQISEVGTYDPTTHLITVKITRYSTINSVTGLYLSTLKNSGQERLIGIFENNETTKTFYLPELDANESPTLGVREFVGSYYPGEPYSDRVTEYTISGSAVMQAANINWRGGSVPLPPKNVNAYKKDNSTIQIEWEWSWQEATKAELSWADHEDAWESTDEPQVYLVDHTKPGKWSICGLSLGEWYIRIRLLKEDGDSVTYGAYYKVDPPIKLSTTPETPSLMVYPTVISKTGSVTFTWGFVSEDGTAQSNARIYEVIYQYKEIEEPTGNPNAQQYYELVDGKYFLTADTTVVSGKTYYEPDTDTPCEYVGPIASTTTPMHVVVKAEDQGWQPNETHHFAVQVTSAMNETNNGYSTPKSVTIANEIDVEMTSTSLVKDSFLPEDAEQGDTPEPYLKLTGFPFTIASEGAPNGGSTTYIIERSRTNTFNRPDDTDYVGFEGEVVYMETVQGPLGISIKQEDLKANFDDNGWYRIIAIARDSYGQSATTTKIPSGDYIEVTATGYAEVENATGSPKDNNYYKLVDGDYVAATEDEPVSGTTYYSVAINPAESEYYKIVSEQYVLATEERMDADTIYYTKEFFDEFKVEWTHQAVHPTATIEIDEENLVSFITPIMPASGYAEGDYVDIYRLSADKPELIVTKAALTSPGTKYVDPYPTLGEFGGYRIVYVTVNGDFIAADTSPAWTDYLARDNDAYKHNTFGLVIDFDNKQVVLPGNVSLSSAWKKDFVETKYLGGSVQGDWNPAVSKTGSLNTTIPVEYAPEDVSLVRDLAEYAGLCHVRTPDGSSFSANVDVKDDREEKWTTQKAKISLDVTRINAEQVDGMTYEKWISGR